MEAPQLPVYREEPEAEIIEVLDRYQRLRRHQVLVSYLSSSRFSPVSAYLESVPHTSETVTTKSVQSHLLSIIEYISRYRSADLREEKLSALVEIFLAVHKDEAVNVLRRAAELTPSAILAEIIIAIGRVSLPFAIEARRVAFQSLTSSRNTDIVDASEIALGDLEYVCQKR